MTEQKSWVEYKKDNYMIIQLIAEAGGGNMRDILWTESERLAMDQSV